MAKVLIDIYPDLKYILPVAAIGLVVIYVIMGSRPVHLLRGFLAATLFALAVLAVGNFTNLGRWPKNRYLNTYEFYHYYTGSKYARALGYTNLYPASLVADDLTKRKFTKGRIRDIETKDGLGSIGVEKVLAEKGRYMALFEDERWQVFVKDILFFKKRLETYDWNYALGDNGYNGTPVWTMVGGTLSNMISTDNEWGMTFLALLDVFLFFGALCCVWRAFGHRTALLMVVLLGTYFMMGHSSLKGAFLRTDWVMCLVMAVCMLKLEHYKTAGVLVAYATLSRIFPVIFMFGIGAKFVLEVVQRRTINRHYLSYFASFTVAIFVLVAASIAYSGGLEIWKEFAIKMAKHNTIISPMRVGFKYVLMIVYKSCVHDGGFRQFFEAWRIFWWGIQIIVILISVFLVRRLKDYEAMAYSFVLVFFLVATTYYYYIMLLVPFLFFATKLEDPARASGMIMLFVSSMVSYYTYSKWWIRYPQFSSVSCMMLGVVLYMMALTLIESLKREKVEPEGG